MRGGRPLLGGRPRRTVGRTDLRLLETSRGEAPYDLSARGAGNEAAAGTAGRGAGSGKPAPW
eukprot:5636213-Alexandrium_andersonii.AAC.1